ncbi:MAG: phytanoyl-CoA dioxygenase family protein [Pseudomonadales bacterium]
MDTNAWIDLLSAAAQLDYIGEPVSQLEHALQTAELARKAHAPDTEVLAALLHDIGHWCDPKAKAMASLGAADHEQLGAQFIRARGLTPEVAELVELHVRAKRYLVARDEAYRARLSAASVATLAYQGGPMIGTEIDYYERHPLMVPALRLRAWDEAAKSAVPAQTTLADYRALFKRCAERPLLEEELQRWSDTGVLVLRGWYDPNEMLALSDITRDLETWPEIPGRWMKYFESTPSNPRMLCRLENFIQYAPVFDAVCNGKGIKQVLRALFGEPVVLFKEKINFKLAGAGGFAPHQDAPAFSSFGQNLHVTVMLSIDPTNAANGCLEVGPHPGRGRSLEAKPDLTLTDQVASQIAWEPIETEPGDLVIFDSFLPHRSGPNQTSSSRRALYATYNLESEGDWRTRYYEEKRSTFPPEVERIQGKRYGSSVFNVGNPIRE